MRTARSGPKVADKQYGTSEHEAWRTIVLQRARFQCEWVESGIRCDRRAPGNTMYADHIKEIEDGGARYDPANGQCLCASHHTIKTQSERAKRQARPA